MASAQEGLCGNACWQIALHFTGAHPPLPALGQWREGRGREGRCEMLAGGRPSELKRLTPVGVTYTLFHGRGGVT